MTFEAGSQIRRLERHTFDCRLSLKSICIAGSAELIGKDSLVSHAFEDGRVPPGPPIRLKTVALEFGSKLREIESGAFAGCHSPKRLRIPASVEQMTDRRPANSCEFLRLRHSY